MISFTRSTFASIAALFISAAPSSAETIRIAIGTQDTTINTVAGGALVREQNLLEKHLPRDGKYKDAQYEIIWKNFTSGPPITNEMVAGKLDIGSMADFPSVLNGVAFQKAGNGVSSKLVSILSGSTIGSGNALVVPIDSPANSLKDLKGKQISVPFGSAAHGMLLRAVSDLGWNPETDVQIVNQSPEVGGTALQTKKIDGHADFVPFGELFPFRGFARKIYDGSQAGHPTSHGTLVRSDFAEKYPELVVAFLKAELEASQRYEQDPEGQSELVEKVTGINAEVNYIFHGPGGIQTRDYTFKPEFITGLKTAVATLKLLKKTDSELNVDQWVDDRFIRQAASELGLDYDARLKSYEPLKLTGNDALTGEPVTDNKLAGQIWVKGEPKVRTYATAKNTLAALKKLEAEGKTVRVTYVQDRNTGLKLLAKTAWFNTATDGSVSAFLLKETAEARAKEHGGVVANFDTVKEAAALASR